MKPSINWYYRRLLAMSAPEVFFRLRRAIQVGLEAFVWRMRGVGSEPSLLAAQHAAQEPAFRWFHSGESARHKVLAARAESFARRFPDGKSRILETVSRIQEGELEVFGQPVRLDSAESWLVDPLTNRRWPMVFWGHVDFRHTKDLGGPLWTWELNRHHHLDALAKAYVLTRDSGLKEFTLNHLVEWIKANPPETGINWASSLEIAVRLINWCWAICLIWETSDAEDRRWQLILGSVHDQAKHIYQHMSAYSSANNHLVGEAAGLSVVGLTFPWLPGAERWATRGQTVLRRELVRQIHSDGVPAEQATGYLAFVLDLNVLTWESVPGGPQAAPEIWRDRLGAASDFVIHIMDEKGHVPSIGDSDDATVLGYYDRHESNRFQFSLAASAVELQRPDAKRAAGTWDEAAHWIMGDEARIRFEATPLADSDPGSRAFREGGYCVMRAPGRMTVFDCGPLGYLSTAAHGHADALTLWLHLDGEPVLVDAGTFAYQEGGAWRRYFRGTSAHNTIVVDGLDQSEQQGDFLWGRKASTHLVRWETTPEYDLAVAEHDGYEGVGVIHRRTVLFAKPDALLVVDDLLGKGRHYVQQLWHFPPETDIEQDDGSLIVRVGQATMRMLPAGHEGLVTSVVAGAKDPIQGWVSTVYGQKRSAPVADVHGRLGFPVRLTTAFQFWDGDDHGGASLDDLLGMYRRLMGGDEN